MCCRSQASRTTWLKIALCRARRRPISFALAVSGILGSNCLTRCSDSRTRDSQPQMPGNPELGIGGSAGGVLSGQLSVPCKQIPAGVVAACPDGSQRNSDGKCPTPTTTSCPFPTFASNGTCCTREAIAAGKCGNIVTDCPEGARRGLNGQCFFVDPGCQGPNCPQPVLPTCIGKDCPTPTTTTCPIAQVSVNGQCCNIREYETGKCGGTTTDCPAGTRRGLNGQCFFVDPGCQGPNCGPVTTGCPLGAPRKADGTCCTGRDYQVGGACGGSADLCPNGKPKKDGQCPQLCPDGSTPREHSHIPCPTKTDEKKKPRHTTPRKPRKPDSDNTEKASPSLPLQIQIGPGIPEWWPSGRKTWERTDQGRWWQLRRKMWLI